jgi:4-diphosphocytidyl-2-C-methyl-D-erythritol kinase
VIGDIAGNDMPPPADEAGGISIRRDTARAKVNLTLEILGRRADGYHELRSLVAFTRFGDSMSLDPGRPFSLDIGGPFASALEDGNLIEAAAKLYASDSQPRGSSLPENGPGIDAACPRRRTGAFRLGKCIPVAAGLGGGSADAAAALRLLVGLPLGAPRLTALLPLATQLGADVPVCLFSRPAIMTGIGEQLAFLPRFPAIPMVLVNPRMPLATAAVFRELRAPPLGSQAGLAVPTDLPGIDDVLDYARQRRNDLEPPARRLLPVIGAILDRLEQCPGALLARLSGSGPTCFALFRITDEAEAAAANLRAEQPGWWVEATVLTFEV